MPSNYYDRPEWSYSQMKKILSSGIDYAVAAKQGLLPEPKSKAIDLGQMIHNTVLGGDDKFIESPYKDYRTKESQIWRDGWRDKGYIIVDQEMSQACAAAVENILNHPHAKTYLTGPEIKHEVELYAKTAEGVALRGKADAIVFHDDGKTPKIIVDIKTTAQFDKFAWSSRYNHYDLQAATYTLLSGTNFSNYYFCVVETVAPYRVQFMHASLEFVEAGERKLRKCVDEILKFGNKQPTFMLEDIPDLGDLSW